MYEDLADFAVQYATKMGASYAESRLESSESNVFVLKNGTLEASGFEEATGLGVRLVVKNTLGFLSTNLLGKNRVKQLVERAVKLTTASSKITEGIDFAKAPIEKAKYNVKEKIKLADVGPEEKIKLLGDIEKSLVGTKLNLPGRYFTIEDWTTKKYYVNSEGTTVESTIPRTNFFYLLTVARGQKSAQRMWQYGATGGWERVERWKLPELLKGEVIVLDKNLQTGQKPPSGKVDLVVSPQISGIIAHESCGHPFEADRILGREAAQAGESYLSADMIGQKVAKPAVTLVDDPTVPGTYGFYLYDDEGVKARRRFLVNEGVITELLHNRETAKTLKTQSNGSARASDFDKEPLIRMSNTFFLPGDYTEEELIEDVKFGIYMKSFMEWNIDDRRYNNRYVGSEAYLIENGKITHPVVNPAIEATTPFIYAAIDAAAKNLEFHSASCGKGEPMQGIPVTTGGPSLRLRGLTLGK